MKRITKIAIIIAFIIAISAFLGIAVSALDNPDIQYTEHCCVMSADYGDILYEKGADDSLAPAGCAKMMTAYLALGYYGDNLDTVVIVNAEAVKDVSGTTTGLSGGEYVTARDLLAALIIANYNDAAEILAYDVSGSTEAFVSEMNKAAKELGMNDTVFKNPTGIDEQGAATTCRDVCTLGAVLCKNRNYTNLSDKTTYTFQTIGSNFTVYNRNCFISTFYNLNYIREGVYGLNSSYTDSVGQCVCVAEKAPTGLSYIITVMGANDPEVMPYKGCNTTYDDAARLIKWASKNFDIFSVVNTADMICEVPVSLSAGVDHVILLPKEKILAMLPTDVNLEEEISLEWELKASELRAPISEGEYVGKLRVYSKSKGYLGEVDLVSKSNVDRSSWLFFLDCAKEFLKSPVVIIILILILLFIIGAIVLISIYVKKRSRRVRYKTPTKKRGKRL